MAKITEIPTQCPNCGGEVWDNTKRPKRNPKAPDVACKDKEYCKWAGWLPESAKTSGGANRAPQEYPHAQLQKLCVQYQLKEIVPLLTQAGYQVTAENIIASAATLFIQATKGGDIFKKAALPSPPAAPTPPPVPPARPVPQNVGMDQGHFQAEPSMSNWTPGDDELPF